MVRTLERMRALEPVRVQSRGRWPQHLEWRGRTFTVIEVIATWCIEGQWWLDPERGGTRRRYFRLHVRASHWGELCVEVYRVHTGEWKLWRVAD